MKKTVLILAILLMATASFAYVEEYKTSDLKTLNGTGYSQETLKVIDTARMTTQGAQKDYVPFFDREFYSKNPFRKAYQMVKRYIDPAQESDIFGVRELKFSNRWFDLSPNYNENATPNDRYQRMLPEDIKRLDHAGKTVEGSGGVEDDQIEDL